MNEISPINANEMCNYSEMLASYAGQLTENLAQTSSNYIKTAGKLFTLPNGTSGPSIDCVVLDFIRINRLMPPFNPMKPTPPLCWAIGRKEAELAPTCENKQAERCATCPKNTFGSSGTGRGKACANGYRLAVVPPDANGNSEVWILNVSPTALKRFNGHVAACRTLTPLGVLGVVTRVSFLPTMAQPSLVFAAGPQHQIQQADLFALVERANEAVLASPEE